MVGQLEGSCFYSNLPLDLHSANDDDNNGDDDGAVVLQLLMGLAV